MVIIVFSKEATNQLDEIIWMKQRGFVVRRVDLQKDSTGYLFPIARTSPQNFSKVNRLIKCRSQLRHLHSTASKEVFSYQVECKYNSKYLLFINRILHNFHLLSQDLWFQWYFFLHHWIWLDNYTTMIKIVPCPQSIHTKIQWIRYQNIWQSSISSNLKHLLKPLAAENHLTVHRKKSFEEKNSTILTDLELIIWDISSRIL